MKSATNIGVMDTVDWQEFCSSLLDQVPATIAPHTGLGYVDGELETVTKPEDLEATLSTWDAAGYKKVSEGGSAEWYMFYPGINFDQSVQERLMDFMGVQDANVRGNLRRTSRHWHGLSTNRRRKWFVGRLRKPF